MGSYEFLVTSYQHSSKMKLLLIGVGVSTFLVFAGIISTWAIIYSAKLESTGCSTDDDCTAPETCNNGQCEATTTTNAATTDPITDPIADPTTDPTTDPTSDPTTDPTSSTYTTTTTITPAPSSTSTTTTTTTATTTGTTTTT